MAVVGGGEITISVTQSLWPDNIDSELDDPNDVRVGVQPCGCGESQGVLQDGDRGGYWDEPGAG